MYKFSNEAKSKLKKNLYVTCSFNYQCFNAYCKFWYYISCINVLFVRLIDSFRFYTCI